VRVRGDVSSQFLTALLMTLPLVAQQDLVIEVEGELISKPYIEITLALLERFGVTVRREAWQRFTIPAGSRLRTPGALYVEGDASAASYFIALGAIAATQAPLRIEGVGSAALQGDVRFAEFAQAMGAAIRMEANAIEVCRGAWPLKALDVDCVAIPDAAMTLAVMALFADAPTRLTGIASWRVKETDRIAAMATELRKLGAQVEEGADWIRVHPLAAFRRARIRTYDDHRMAMCFALTALNAKVPVRIDDPACVAKTFPDYFETLFERVEAGEVPVIAIDGPTASGKGTLAHAVAEQAGLRRCWIPARSTAPPPWRHSAPAWTGPMPTPWQRSARACRCDSRPTASCWATRMSARRCARKPSAWAPPPWRPTLRCAWPCTSCSCPSAALRVWWPTAGTWATVVFPDAATQEFSSPRAPRRAPSAVTSN
jgi:hypothetical protein